MSGEGSSYTYKRAIQHITEKLEGLEEERLAVLTKYKRFMSKGSEEEQARARHELVRIGREVDAVSAERTRTDELLYSAIEEEERAVREALEAEAERMG